MKCETKEFSNGVTITSFGASSPKYAPQRNPSTCSTNDESNKR